MSKAQNQTFTTKLPIVYIDTNGGVIQDTPRIKAKMEIAWNENGDENSTTDPRKHFNGNVKIEIRGSSSQMFPKKSYGFELKDSIDQDLDFPLLGMPEEEDWILYAPYSDKSLIRNVLTFTLASTLGNYVPRCRFVELFVNNDYRGIYVLMEKIKRDKNRIDIAKLKKEDIAGEDLTGGYIFKIDKQTGSGGDGWYSSFLSNGTNTFYQYEYPKADEIQQPQKEYIQNYMNEFETALYNKDPDYSTFMNVPSFFDYIIMNEISKNVDGYRLSTFLFKDKNDKLNAGPIWDFNLGYGNANYAKAWESYGLELYVDLGGDYWQNPFWWISLLNDSHFANPLKCRWDSLRKNQLSDKHILEVADSLVDLVNDAATRNYQRWPVIGEWVWPNYFVGSSYQEEVNWLKNWITDRLRWLDFALPGDCNVDSVLTPPVGDPGIEVFPNPFTSKFTLQIISKTNLIYRFQLFSVNGQRVFDQMYSVTEGLNSIEINTENLQQGIYFYRLYKGNTEVLVDKIIKM
ncbi:MAG: CotH kinase family protein [Draconibacterium sp.]|nr:CotH kinase family protein [Draconibacterium sp.]